MPFASSQLTSLPEYLVFQSHAMSPGVRLCWGRLEYGVGSKGSKEITYSPCSILPHVVQDVCSGQGIVAVKKVEAVVLKTDSNFSVVKSSAGASDSALANCTSEISDELKPESRPQY